jgi:hypothetical protein
MGPPPVAAAAPAAAAAAPPVAAAAPAAAPAAAAAPEAVSVVGGVSLGGAALWLAVIGVFVSPYFTTPSSKEYPKQTGQKSLSPSERIATIPFQESDGKLSDPYATESIKDSNQNSIGTSQPSLKTAPQDQQVENTKKITLTTKPATNTSPRVLPSSVAPNQPDPCSDCSDSNWRKYNSDFMQEKLNQILSNLNHPLSFLVDRQLDDPHKGTWKSRSNKNQMGVHAGHRFNKLGCEQGFGKLSLAVEEGWGNIYDSSTDKKFAVSKGTVMIEGVEVDYGSALSWQRQGLLNNVDLKSLRVSDEGWKPPICH